MKTSNALLIGILCAVFALWLQSCVVTAPYGYYDTLPGTYVGPYYYVGNRYYYGGRWESGRYFYGGRYYADRYFHNGHYYYGGRYYGGR